MDNDWTSDEIEKYKKTRIKKLGPFYAEQNISIDNPRMRLDYLIERVFNFTKEDINKMRKLVDINDKPEFLKFLEERVVEKFF